MAPWKQHILLLLTVACLCERILSHENLNQQQNTSYKNRKSYPDNDSFDSSSNMARRNQNKNEDQIGNSASIRESSSTDRKEADKAYNTDKQNFGKNDKIEDEWDLTKLINYLLSFIIELEEENNAEMHDSSVESGSKNNKQQPLNEKPFLTYNGECRTDDCDSIPRNEDYRRHRSVKENPDVSFNHEDKDGKQQGKKHAHEYSKHSDGDTSKKTSTFSNESEENTQSVDSNPDVAFDRDDEGREKDPLEGKYTSKTSEESEEDISDSQSRSADENDDSISSNESYSDFEFSGESESKPKRQEAQSDEKSLPEDNGEEYDDSNHNFNSGIEKKNVSENEVSVPHTYQKPMRTRELSGEENLSESQTNKKSKESNESKTRYLNQYERDFESENKSNNKKLPEKGKSCKIQPEHIFEEADFEGPRTGDNNSKKDPLPIEEESARAQENQRKANSSMTYKNGSENTDNKSKSDTTVMTGKEKVPKEKKIPQNKKYSKNPTQEDNINPTQEDSIYPTQEDGISPTQKDSIYPTQEDSIYPTQEDSIYPTQEDSIYPTQEDGMSPTQKDGISPTQEDSISPTQKDSIYPTQEDRMSPTQGKSIYPTQEASIYPTQGSIYTTHEDSIYTTHEDSIHSTHEDSIHSTQKENINPTQEDSMYTTQEENVYPTQQASIYTKPEDSIYPTPENSDNDASNSKRKFNAIKMEHGKNKEPNDLNNAVAGHENTKGEKNHKDQNKITSKYVPMKTDENNTNTEELPLKRPNDTSIFGTNPEQLRPEQTNENSDNVTKLEAKDNQRELGNERGVVYDKKTKPNIETDEGHDKETKQSYDGAKYDFEEVELNDEDYEEYYEEEDEEEDEMDEDQDTYDFYTTYFDNSFPGNEDNHSEGASGYTVQEQFTSQMNENVMENPNLISNESYEERNKSYFNHYKPPESFDTILEYLYKHANNPLFNSLKYQNETEMENRNMTDMELI